MNRKVSIVIQARMGSCRLRGKSLIPILGKPLLHRVIETAKNIKFANEIIVATTVLPEDDPIVSFAKDLDIKVFRGDALNVLKRFVNSTEHLDENDILIRLTADNPLNWVSKSEKLFNIHISNNNDYTCIEGLSHIVCEIVRVGALRKCFKSQNLVPFDKEHVTPYLRKNKNIFKIMELPANFDGLRHDLDKYLTIDTSEDLYRFDNFGKSIDINGFVDFNSLYGWLDKNVLKISTEPTIDDIIVNLNGISVGKKFPTYIIAEIGQNHNGDVQIAKKLIDMAVRCDANAVKFQKRDIASELTSVAYNKIYDNPNSFGKTYGEHREFLELNEQQHLELKEYAIASGITYFCTSCDVVSVEMMERIGNPFYKVASRDLTNIPLLESLSKVNKPVIISTGMATKLDIEEAIKTLNLGKDKLIIMQCTSEYPCNIENINLRVIDTLHKQYGYLVGLSDHSSGVIIASVASALGAVIVEKHITLDRTMKGTDHPGSLEESGLKKLVQYIRSIELAMGDGEKEFNPIVQDSKNKLARSLTSKCRIRKGVVLKEDMLCLKSPGRGLLWRERNIIIDKIAKKNIEANVTLFKEMFE